MGNFFSILKGLLGLGPSDPTANLAPTEAFQRLKSGNPHQLVDVRSGEENKQNRIAGSRHIPLQELGKRVPELDPNKPVLLYCQSGARSGMALRMLKGAGFSQAAHIRGGLSAWRFSNLPVESSR